MLHVKVSKKQLSKLRNGHKVRVSEAMKGEGINLIVHPQRYDEVTKTFKKKKGIEIQLTPKEISLNKEYAEMPDEELEEELEGLAGLEWMKGNGIFGRKFDNFVEKTIGKKAKDTIYKGADKIKPFVKQGISKVAELAPEIGATALSGVAMALGQPELVPVAQMAGRQLGKMAGDAGKSFASDYLDDPEKYQGYSDRSGNRDVNAPKTLQGAVEHNETLQAMNKDLGTQYGNLARASMGNLEAHRRQAGMVNRQAMTRPEMPSPAIVPEYMRNPSQFDPVSESQKPAPKKGNKGKGIKDTDVEEASDGQGLYAGGYGLFAGGRGFYKDAKGHNTGGGLYAGGQGMYAGRGLRREHGTIGRGGGFVGANQTLPSALQSKPFSSNFQFQYTLPPQYQKFSRGGDYA